MPRRRGNKRKNDFDDTLERAYMMSKRPREEAAVEENSEATNHRHGEQPSSQTTITPRATVEQHKEQGTDEKTSESSSLDRLREKKRQRKERKKAKAEDRRQKQKMQEEERTKQKQLIQQQKKRQLEEKAKYSSASNQNPDGQLITTRKGVQYQDIVIGTGPEIRTGKQIQVKYTLRSAPGKGKVLDSSQNFATRLGRGEVIEGWDIGLKGMKRGGLRHLIVPPQAGYGQQNIGAGKGASLYFEIRLLSC